MQPCTSPEVHVCAVRGLFEAIHVTVFELGLCSSLTIRDNVDTQGMDALTHPSFKEACMKLAQGGPKKRPLA